MVLRSYSTALHPWLIHCLSSLQTPYDRFAITEPYHCAWESSKTLVHLILIFHLSHREGAISHCKYNKMKRETWSQSLLSCPGGGRQRQIWSLAPVPELSSLGSISFDRGWALFSSVPQASVMTTSWWTLKRKKWQGMAMVIIMKNNSSLYYCPGTSVPSITLSWYLHWN